MCFNCPPLSFKNYSLIHTVSFISLFVWLIFFVLFNICSGSTSTNFGLNQLAIVCPFVRIYPVYL